MLEPPPYFSEESLKLVVETAYGLTLASLGFLPLGADSAAWVYRAATTDGLGYFVKVRRGSAYEASLSVPRFLVDHAIPNLLAPIRATDGALWTQFDEFVVIVYPFIDGENGGTVGLSDDHWRAFGGSMRRIHDTTLPPELAQTVKHESWTPLWSPVARQLAAYIANRHFVDPFEIDFAKFWHIHQATIMTLLERADQLGNQLQMANLPLAVCHSDAHPWNLMVDRDNRLWIIDWDELILAPRERDLIFVIDSMMTSVMGRREETLFLEGYGPATIDHLAMTYFRLVWLIGDIASYAQEALLMPDLGSETRTVAAQRFMSMFQLGDIVDKLLAESGA